jgi:predicted metal-dependent peptidase
MIDHRTFDKKALAHTQDAVTNLVLRAEIAGLSLLGESIRIVQDNTVETMCTDGRVIRVGGAWLETNGFRGNLFDLLHEWLHCFLNHVARLGNRDPKIWNIACDVVVVRMACETLTRGADVWAPPEDGVIPPPWAEKMSAEEIYEIIKKDTDKRKQCLPQKPKSGSSELSTGELQTSGDFDYKSAQAYTPDQEAKFQESFTSELAYAQLVVQNMGQSLESKYGNAFVSRLQEILRGTIPWGRLLKGKLISAVSPKVATWAPPRRKHFPMLILPSYKCRREPKLLIAIDVSASVGQKLENEFIANVMPAASRAKETVIVVFDQKIREVYITSRPREIFSKVKFLSGSHSHTDVRPVFDLVEQHRPSGVAILTDAMVKYPTKKYPETVWAVPEQYAHLVPWGKVFKMTVSW